jgi:transaldolase
MKELQISMLGPSGVGKTTLITAMYEQFESNIGSTDLQLTPDDDSSAILQDNLVDLKSLLDVFEPRGRMGIQGTEAILKHYKDICDIVKMPVSAEVISTDFDGMIAEGKKLAALDPNIVVKVPMIKDGIKAIKWFTDNGIKTNCTLVFSAGQAILAAKAGATYVSPFIGRLDDISVDGLELIAQIRLIFDNYGFQTQILAASVRHPIHIIKCAEIGSDVMTGPLSAMLALLKHPLTDSGLEKFLADYKKVNG